MITSLELENYRGFGRHTVPLRETTVMVGANNAGKSTVVEALRLVAAVTDRFRTGSGRIAPVPDWLSHSDGFDGVALSTRPAASAESSIFNRYGDAPAIVRATFDSGAVVNVFVGPESQTHGVLRKADGAPVGRMAKSNPWGLDVVSVQPQVAPLMREEPPRQDATIRRGDGTYLAPQHFRNQLRLFSNHFPRFKELAEASWRGLQIRELGSSGSAERPFLRLDIRDADFVGEASLMGHGLQMWLQLMWFLARTPPEATVVLDEPDVYMHPDLQRTLLSLVREQFGQLVIATHSTEIISDVDPEAILAIDRRRQESKFVTSLPGLQSVLNDLGSVQNLQVARLMRAKAFYLVEGDDVKLLRRLQGVLSPTDTPIDLIPHAEMGGRGGWSSGVARKLPTMNAEGAPIRSFAILDRDYFPSDEVRERYEDAQNWRIELHVWSKKEIENYLLVPTAIARFVNARTKAGTSGTTADDVSAQIDRIVEGLKDDPILDSLTTYIHSRNKAAGVSNAAKLARKRLNECWGERESRWAIAPGKLVIRGLSRWAQATYGVGIGVDPLAREIRPEEIHPEVVEVIAAIVRYRPFGGPCGVQAEVQVSPGR